MLIDSKGIALACAVAACGAAMAWLRVSARSVDELVAHRPDWALWAVQLDGWADALGAARLDACAEVWPADALVYASAWLSPDRLDACAAACPREALRYASALLTPICLDACAEARPLAALECAAARLTPARLAWCQAQS